LTSFIGKNAGRCQFSNNAPGWGWSRFISLEDFKNSANGYLVKTKCCVEAEVEFIGSSTVEHGLNRSAAKRVKCV